MKRLVPMFDNSGARYSIPEDRVDEFRADMGEVAEARRYRGKDGQHYTIPQDQDEAFRADMPDAVPVRSYTMADGTRRDFTMGEMAKFLRSKEYRESEDYTPPQMGSPTWAGIKGALTGAAEGAYYGGKNALAKVATALPEAAASVGEAVGDAVNLGGNAKNPVGDWLRASGQQTKRWLGENIRGDQYDENGNLVMSGLTKDLGYEDTLTKIGETAGDAAAMAVKFAPAAIAGPAYMETILASDGINAFADTFDRAKAAGYSDMEANLAGAASGLINYYGAKLMMKGGAATKDIANPLLRALAGTGFTGAATAAQAVGNKGVENVIEGKPITEGMLGAAGEGFVEGAQFHLINEVGTNAKASMQIRRETREMKEMRKENLLTATETPDGRAFLNTVVQNEGVDAAIRARKDGKDVSRKMGAAADLPDNMSASERNAVIDGISKAREAQAERVRTKMDDVQAQSLADEIGQNLMGGASNPMFEDIWLNATRRVKNAAELDEPGARARIVGEAIEDVVGKQLDAGPANRIDTPLEKKIAQNRSRIGQEQKAQRKSDLDEYERQEQERIAREKAEQDAQMAEDERARAGGLIAEGAEANVPVRETSEYKAWLRKQGRTDTDKNFNRYVAERGLDASLKVERGHNGPNEQTKAELEMGRRIEAQGEAQRKAAADKAQADYDEKMAAYEEARAKRAAEKKRGVAKEKLTPLPEKPVEKKVEEENLMPTDDELYEQARNKIGDGATSEEIDEVVSKTKATLLERGFVARKSKNPAQVGKEAAENAEIGATKAGNAAENVQPTKVPDGRGRMVEKNSGDISSESVNSELERYVGKDELSNIKDRANSTKFENGGFPEDISVLAETCRGIANRTGNPPSAKSLAEAVADSWKRHTYESIKATADIILDAYKRDGKKVPKIFADKYGTEPDADFYQKNTKSEEERLASVYGMKPQPSKPLENAPSRAQKEAKPMSQADGAEGKEARNGASSVDDFVSTMKPMAAAKAKKTLGARRDYGIGNEHDVMTDAEFVERNVQKGGVVSARVFATSGKPKVSYILGDTEITKTQFDYAKHLGVKVDANSIERAKEEVLLKGVLAKGEGVSKRDYFPSDENVEEAIKELDGTNFVKYRKDLKEEFDTLKSIRDARIKRGDWSIEQKTTSTRVPDGKGKMVKKATATPSHPDAEASAPKQVKPEAEARKPKMTLQDAEAEIRKFLNGEEGARAEDVVAQFGPDKAQRILATATKDYKSTTASNNRVSQLQKYIENKMGKIGPSDNRGSFAGRQKTVPELKKRFDEEKTAAMKPLDDALREIANGEEGSAKNWDDAKRARFDELLGKGKLTKGEMDELAILVGGPNGSRETIEVPLGKTGSLKVYKSTRELIQVRQNLHERYGKEASKRYYEIDTSTPAQKLADPDFKAWARKQGRTPTDGARRIYDAQRVDAVFSVAKNWLKGVTMRRTENAADVPQGARMSIVEDGEILKELDNGETITLYRAMQLGEDGQLRPPMSGKVEGKWREGEPIGKWQQSEERPDLVDKDGNFTLNKGKKSIKAKYNPYFHQSDTPLNDQFAEAYKRPELVVVEVEIPKSELTSGYKAEKAKDAVGGPMKWKGGPVDNALPSSDRRGVYLSRFTKIKRVVSESEAAKIVAEKLKRNGVSVPDNVVTPSMRKALEAEGVKISESGKIRYLYSRDGNVVGWYDRAKKEVVTLPGADAATVAHELGWHATYEYAQAEAAQGRTALLDKLTEYANNAPQSVKNEILRKYGMATDAATLLDEIGAARYTMDNVNKIKDVADRRQAAKWYQRTWNAIADTYKAMLSKFGWNKARLDNLSALTPEETVNLLADEMLKGRTLGKAKSSQIDMSKGETIAQLHDRKLKDRLRPIEEIEKEAGKSVENSAHTLFRNLPGKVQGAIDKAQNFADKVKADCKKAGIKIDELNEFLYANAASERNAKVLARNGRLDGSAMSHADIQRILTAYRNSPKYAELRRIADEVLAFQRKGFDFRRKAGLISDETWNTLLADEPNHVPMKSRFDPNGEHMGFSLTEQFGKPEWKTAEGRTNVGDGPLEWIVQEYVDAFSRGHENTARRALLETVLAHPEIGEVKKLGPNDALGEVKRKGQQGDPNVFIVKTDGDTYQVRLNGMRGELIARAVSGRGLMRMDWTNAKIPHTEISVRNAMRWWSATATSWSPTFAGRNFLADTMDVFAVNIGEKGIIKGTAAFGKHVSTALKLTNAIRKYASTGETTDPLIREAVDAGVLMGGGVRGQAFADAGEAALKTLKTDWGNGKNRIKAVRNVMFGWIDTLNQTAELMNRMADYKMQREAGKGKNEAALHAREITVDFNEKGELTPITNMLYMFSNSTLGATMRLNKAIFASKEGKSLAAGTFALGLIEGMAEALSNGDDEDGKNMNEYTRANSFYFRSGKNVFRIPLHASPISVIKYAGNCTARKLFGTLNGDKAAEQVAKDMIGMMTSYLGIGALGDNEAASIAPTIVQPFVQAYMNRDFADRPIERTSFSEEKPKSGNGRPSTPQFYKDLATWLNEFGGGNAGRKGELNLLGEKIGTDFSPEMLKHFAEATGKNALRDIENTVEFAKMVLGKTEWDRRNVPVGRDYFRTTGGNDNRFFEAVRAYKTDAEDFKQRTGSDKSDFRKSHPWLREGNDGKTTVNRLINMTNRDNPRSGLGSMGITQLRKLTEGKVRRKDGSYFEPKTPVSDELKERAREWLQKRQARVIEIMGK